ncbi:sensor domain-containing protein [Massilia scottii]|uniref:sensor domain-containing protein n=1 Tax=Massilia scottii TaxID=3057166 RepID=UPI002796CCB6|nr:EAL domain-containing protein [Massilia sp. CCM 9029]MDQ1829596.1 EAL domain-containing protein [Massilia sp. CCM 9029]
MSADKPAETGSVEPEGPGLQALDVLYRFVAALELAPTVAVHSTDRNGIVRYWNHTCADVFGVTAAEAVGQPLTSLASHLDREEDFRNTLETVWKTGRTAPPRDWHIRRRDGAERWLYSTHFPVLRDGVPQQLFCMEVDISKRKVDEAALIEAGTNFRQLFERSHDAIVLIEGNRIIDANPAAVALFRCTDKQDIVGKTLLDFSPEVQATGETSVVADAALTARAFIDGNHRYEWEFCLPDGAHIWVEVLLTSVTLDHEFRSYAVLRDISPRKAAEHALAMAARVFEKSRDAILITDRFYRVIAVNQAFTELTGVAAAEVMGGDVPGLRSGMHEPSFYQQIWDFVAVHDHWEGEVCCVRRGDGDVPIWVAVTAIRDSAEQVSNYMAIMTDITERKRAEEQTRYLAEHDFLTDLPNRVLFLDRLQQALVSARRQHTKVGVMFLDLDRFKGINDSFGHQVGDAVLKEVATRLTGCVRGVDTVSRQGGDEFVVILADIGGVDQAAHVATSVMHAVAQPVRSDGHTISLSVSIGIAISPDDGADIDTLLKNADVAMYHAKQNGRNAFSFFNVDMNAHVIERVQIENELRHALSNQEFLLEYLPEVNIASGQTIAVEALLRWRHPQRGLLMPHQFIAVAEECGLMVPIGEWVLRQACARARVWRDEGCPVVVAVNLSGGQFIDSGLVHSVEEALRLSGLAPEFLDLEFTESVIMRGDDATMATIATLRALGVQLTIDDFGTGYSSLSFLRRYPLTKLKIDSSFVKDIVDANTDPAPDAGGPVNASANADLIPAIIAVARSLKLRVIAEGVETAEQLRFLRQHGCDDYQGYYASMASSDPDLKPRPH